MISKYVIGQHWISETEPELGVCSVTDIEFKRLGVHFSSSNEDRIYSLENAPLIRVIHQLDDILTLGNDKTFKVKKIIKKDNLFYYSDGKSEYIETSIRATVDYSDAFSRLKNLDFDSRERFNLRNETLTLQATQRSSKLRGFSGGRIELLPHQLYIVNKIVSSPTHRVLLSDEVGLGKTIEAALLLHRFILTGEVTRALIVVPDHLVHQWFLELYSRFNLTFDILDEIRYDTFEQNSSLLICGIDFLTSNPKYSKEITESKWDILIVDEVHHLEWSSDDDYCDGYALIKILTELIEKVILLSATPEQLGTEGHFARLKLLDPDRYYDLNKFADEQRHYNKAAKLAKKLLKNQKITKLEEDIINSLLPKRNENKTSSNEQVEALLDHYGTGRAIYRNTRHVIKGFPKRVAMLEEIISDYPTQKEFQFEYIDKKIDTSLVFDYDYKKDPRIIWLIKKLKEFKDEKFLLICHSKEKIIAIQDALLKRENFKIVLFHEEMTVMNRDRGAAWFAEKNGAKILLCSEIGSEGRNFQFANHLVLFDLPLNPELLEQRIGRLDRIGQKKDISIHIPYIKGTPQELLVRWYNEGLNAIEEHLPVGHEFIKPFSKKVIDLALSPYNEKDINKLISQSRIFRDNLINKLKEGRDHLLEMHSFNEYEAKGIVEKIKSIDSDTILDKYILKALDQFRVGMEVMSNRSYILSPANALISLPWLKNEDIEITCNRERAIHSENIAFVSWDHPLTVGIIDSIISSTFGNCSFATMKSDKPKILLEVWFLIECNGPKDLHIDRFMPPIPVRVLLDHANNDLTSKLTVNELSSMLSDGKKHLLSGNPKIIKELIPKLLESAKKIATKKKSKIIDKGIRTINNELDIEIARLIPLQKKNPNIEIKDINILKNKKNSLIECVKSSNIRIDSISIIIGK